MGLDRGQCTEAVMGWICFILLIVWTIWTVCTNIGKIVAFLALVVCGIVAASFGILAFEYTVIRLARAISFIQDHGWLAPLSVVGIVAVVFVMNNVRNIPVVHYTASDRHQDQ
jgi:hypothetical protein